MLELGKEREKQKAQGKGINSRSHFVLVIETKWVFRNKQDQDGIVIRNKARLVAQDYTQVEGLDFGKTYAPVKGPNG